MSDDQNEGHGHHTPCPLLRTSSSSKLLKRTSSVIKMNKIPTKKGQQKIIGESKETWRGKQNKSESGTSWT